MTEVQETLLTEYRQYLDKAIIARKNEHIHTAQSILSLCENTTDLYLINQQAMKHLFTSDWQTHKASRFLTFLKVKGYVNCEKGAVLNSMNDKKIDEYFGEFITMQKARGKADNTICNYKIYFKYFCDYLNTAHTFNLRDISGRVIENYKEYLYMKEYGKDKKHFTISTQRDALNFVRRYYEYLYDIKYIEYNPAKKVKLQLGSEPLSMNCLCHEDMLKVLRLMPHRGAYEKRNFMIVYLSYFYGLRVSECSKLTVSDIDFHNRYIYIIDSKGRKDRVLPLIEPAMSMLETYIRGALPKIMNDKIKPRSVDRRRADSTKQYLFPAMYSKSRMNKQPLQRVFLRAVKNAGINRPLTFHCLRYSFATNILHRGMGIRYAQMIMGHEDINSTGRYTKVLTDDLRRALKQYHPREQKAASVINGIKAGGYECTGLYSKISGKPEKRQLQQEIN